MEIIQANEAFKRTDQGLKFSHVKYLVKYEGGLYYGKWNDRHEPPTAFSQLDDIKKVKTEDRGPNISPGWSQIYIKTPPVLAYVQRSEADLEEDIRREVSVCEILKQNPHRNIAIYYGCQELNGRVSGLCFKRYASTLEEQVNPGHLNKDAFRSSRIVDDTVIAALPGILAGIEHLHSLGLVHNDINPSNIMLDEDDTPVLIDFGSCRYVGESLRGTGAGRTPYWYDPAVEIAESQNDLDAYDEIRRWLIGDAKEEFLFTS
ncbi:hypothetical protein BDW74DRAFT_174431 [Aspergillus multicolor]|uniref:uncharacterized protein n=1 Tax=Aspergillus multicolor TaxID=41759 RepID=UPI003CCCCBE8